MVFFPCVIMPQLYHQGINLSVPMICTKKRVHWFGLLLVTVLPWHLPLNWLHWLESWFHLVNSSLDHFESHQIMCFYFCATFRSLRFGNFGVWFVFDCFILIEYFLGRPNISSFPMGRFTAWGWRFDRSSFNPWLLCSWFSSCTLAHAMASIQTNVLVGCCQTDQSMSVLVVNAYTGC